MDTPVALLSLTPCSLSYLSAALGCEPPGGTTRWFPAQGGTQQLWTTHQTHQCRGSTLNLRDVAVTAPPLQLRAEPGPESPPVSPRTLMCAGPGPQRRKVSSERQETCQEGRGPRCEPRSTQAASRGPPVSCKDYSRTVKYTEHSSEVMATQEPSIFLAHKPNFLPSAGESRHSVPGAQTVKMPTDAFQPCFAENPQESSRPRRKQQRP